MSDELIPEDGMAEADHLPDEPDNIVDLDDPEIEVLDGPEGEE